MMRLFKENKILRFLGSVKLALILLWSIIIVCLIGAIIPSLLPEDARINFFGSGWFFALLMVFGLNISICAFSRMSFAAKKLGSTLAHLSIILILLGSLISYFFSIRGTMEIEEGQSQDRMISGCKIHKLDFKLFLEDFSIEWYSIRPDKYEIKARVESGQVVAGYKLDKAQEQKIADTGYSFAVKDYLPDFGLDENRKAYNKSDQPNNPAVLLLINLPSGASEERWVFANHPGMGLSRDENIQFRFEYQPQVKQYLSRVRIIDDRNGRIENATIKVNSPLSYKGYSFYQADYDHDQQKFTVLEAVFDPGVGFVFTGFLVLNLGLAIIFYPKLRSGFNRKNKA
jgi:cytochrome c biogenesis protein ResB